MSSNPPTNKSAGTSFFGWKVAEGSLVLGERSLRSLADEYGTPLYVYDESRVLDRATTLKQAFPAFSVLYSLKSNPQPRICSLLSRAGFGAGVSSLAEFDLALSTGYAANDIGYVGPGKRPADLLHTAKEHCGVFYVESRTELERLESLSRELKHRMPVAIRINTQHRPTSAGEFMAGGPSEFGIDEEILDEIIPSIDTTCIDLMGFHTFVASQVVDQRSLERHFERVATIVSSLAARHSIDLRVVNFGGGFGIPYTSYERELNVICLGERVAANAAVRGLRKRWPGARLFIDVGRFLVGNAGMFLTRIVDVKKSRGSTFVVTDSGVTGFARPSMSWAQQHPCCVVDKMNGNDTRSVSCSVVGPSCMPGDMLATSAYLANPVPDDVLGFMNAGAYGRTMSFLAWGGFDQPRELNFDGDQFYA